uniref:Uncharacterized protein n=1 Tax=Anguilla anguilla TaxID=7936 RepID=A0A0E9WIH2_ANGAN
MFLIFLLSFLHPGAKPLALWVFCRSKLAN